MPADPDEPGVGDPANRTRLSWTRTAIAFAAIGAAMLKSSPIAGVVVIALSLPIWAAAHRVRHTTGAVSAASGLALVAITVVLVAIAALGVALFGHSSGLPVK
jgi:fumarate reductase subunit D